MKKCMDRITIIPHNAILVKQGYKEEKEYEENMFQT